MSGKSRFAVLLLAFMLVASTGVTYASAQTDGEYSVEAQNTIDIPDRTVTVEGTNYTVTSIGKVTAGETLQATTSGPDGETFDVLLYSGIDTDNRQIVNSDEGTDGSVSLSTENLQPGTYILAISTAVDSTAGGSTVSPQPVVVAGYETTLNAPSELTTGESGTVSVQLDDVANLGSPENVELVVTQNDEVVDTVQMTNESTYNYTAEVGSSLDSGEYRMYAMVHNETTVGGDNALGDDNDVVGVTDAQTLTVSSGGAQPQANDESGQNDNDDSDSESSDSGSYSSDSGSSDVGTATSTAAPNETETGTTTVAMTEMNETSDEPTATTEVTETATDTQTEASGTSTDSSMPNFALYIVALALVAAALIARR